MGQCDHMNANLAQDTGGDAAVASDRRAESRVRAARSRCSSSTTKPSNLASLEKIFQREGMRVFTADGAKAALEVARQTPRAGRAHGSDDAGHERRRAAARAERSVARHRGRADDRLRHGRDRRASDARRRVRLRRKAAEAHDDREERAQGGGAAVAGRRKSLAASRS